VKGALWCVAAIVAIVLVVGALLSIPFSSAPDVRAIAASGTVAVAVQLGAFLAARRWAGPGLGSGWVLGIFMRFLTLVVYGGIAVKALGMPAPAALISLASFFFVSTLVEPKLLTL
jgi:hypothetical protein